MSEIVPRWEWRAFGMDFGEAEARFASLQVEAVQESDETYLLSPASDETVKIRAELMDIKKRVETNDAGLEQWRPVMKQSFPIPLAEVARVCAELNVTPPRSGSDAFSLDELLALLEMPERGIRAVAVHKRRVRYTVNGCISEVTDVVADGTPVRTIAIESEDPARVIAAVAEMGLMGYTNTSYPCWLKSLSA